MKKWKTVKSCLKASCQVFDVWEDTRVNPIDNKEHPYYSIRAPEWATIIVVTSDNKIIIERQYRHGSNEISLEFPAGMIKENEDPKDGIKRELMEETGYHADNIIYLGRVRPNPAILNNYNYFYAAFDAKKDNSPNLDGDEEIEVELFSLEKVKKYIENGKIDNIFTVACLHYFEEYLKKISANKKIKDYQLVDHKPR